jgi:hypothetical protein
LYIPIFMFLNSRREDKRFCTESEISLPKLITQFHAFYMPYLYHHFKCIVTFVWLER